MNLKRDQNLRLNGGRALAMAWIVALSTLQTSSYAQSIPHADRGALRGAGSCSATACHGGPQSKNPLGILRNESMTWVTNDRHASAFAVLDNERSKAIIKRLGTGWKAATQEGRCLACHSTPADVPKSVEESVIARDGVSCESCHGAAGDWIDLHTTNQWTRDFGVRSTHFRAMTNLVSRAQTCAGCHVGEPAKADQGLRDVDHSLIAAGHPRLDFEFSAYLANMPSHWRASTQPDASPEFTARAWALGQVVAAKASLELLADRAERFVASQADVDPNHVAIAWPEFGEYGCFSCHHALRDDRWRHDRKNLEGSALGGLVWGSWLFSQVDTLAGASAEPSAKSSQGSLAPIRTTMKQSVPDPSQVVREARAAAQALAPWIDELSRAELSPARIEAILEAVAHAPDRGEVSSWDAAAQNYLALVPLNQALARLGKPKSNLITNEDFQRIRDYLQFPEGYESPNGKQPKTLK